ncbi:hypothetical protein [Bdellovibrio sp. HCB288]|uniref:hypothetical protein n=1 Tax=Bdellovibrio sp. HCB288 TaxID=3394355 RepID=UPI0039B63C04
MSSTSGLIKKYQQELQKLRAEYLRKSSDPAEKQRLEAMIRNRKEVLSQLGAQREIF